MAGLIRVSEAANLALHAAALLASSRGGRLSTKDMAARLGASEAHLAKVMRRLVRAGLATSSRGPAGGFRLARPASRITLKDVYEAIEGRLEPVRCMFGAPVCGRRACILGGLVREVEGRIRAKLSGTKLSEVGIGLEVES